MITTETETEAYISERMQRLQKGYEALTSTDNFKSWLTLLATQYNYSLANTILIWCQKPNATLVKGYRQWQELGRHVRKGEKSILIYAPVTRKDPLDPNKSVVMGFRAVRVFDISQTDGPALPELPDKAALDGNAPQQILDAAAAIIAYCNHAHAIDVVYEPLGDDTVGGYCQPKNRHIVINTKTSTLNQFRVLLHELAHQITFDILNDHELANINRSDHEFLAESAAYVACTWANVDTYEVSTIYLQSHTKSTDRLVELMPLISKITKKLLHTLEEATCKPTAYPSPMPSHHSAT